MYMFENNDITNIKQIDEMNPAGLLKVAIELDAFATQFQPIVNAIIASEVTVIVLSDDDA